MAATDKIECKIDGAMVHSIKHYIDKNYAGEWTIERYKDEFPGAPLLSEIAAKEVKKLRAEKEKLKAEASVVRKELSDVFGLPPDKCKNGRGEQIMIRVFQPSELVDGSADLVPDVDDNYVFQIEHVKNVLMAWETNKTIYNWGLHGTGKTTLFEQCAALTKRPFLRVQHTVNTEESHVLGQMRVAKEVHVDPDGKESVHLVTKFDLGPLPLAMLNGWIYCADEYDAAVPSVSLLYQPVLERKPLYIKEAPPELRLIKPHPNFRFCATGNTNGSGDETGLYQGTQMQNAANYSRFNMTIETDYPEPKVEEAIVARQGGIKLADAKKLVEFATDWRKSFRGGQVSMTVSPRELIEAANIGFMRGSDWNAGLALAFANRLSRTDKEVAAQFAQRIFGHAG